MIRKTLIQRFTSKQQNARSLGRGGTKDGKLRETQNSVTAKNKMSTSKYSR